MACGRTEEVSLRRLDMQELWAKEESKGERGPGLVSSYIERLRPEVVYAGLLGATLATQGGLEHSRL